MFGGIEALELFFRTTRPLTLTIGSETVVETTEVPEITKSISRTVAFAAT
jgi:hypothetical protein